MFPRGGEASWPATVCDRVEEHERKSWKFTALWHPDDVCNVYLCYPAGYCQVREMSVLMSAKVYLYQYCGLKFGWSGCHNWIVCFRSLLTFVAMDAGTLSYELLLRYLTLCVSGGHDAEASEVYDIMRGSFPSLDTGASSLFIKSFSRTGRWREALNILNELKMASTRLF